MDALEQHLSRQAQRSRDFFWNRLRWDLVCEQLPRSERCELVDVGAGTGFLGDVLRTRLPQVEYRFVEPLEGLEAELERRFGADANRRDAASFGDARFVTLLDVLEHQEDDRRFLEELAARMAPGSRLLLTVPALSSLWSQWDVALGHFRRYDRGSLAAAVEGVPLETIETAYLFPELLPLGLLRRLRHPPERAADGDAGAEFPDLPHWLNGLLYRLGSGSLRLRRRWPAGTSLFAVMRRVG